MSANFQLKVINGEPMGATFALHPGATRIGRSPDSDVVLSAAGVSREQLVIHRNGTALRIENKSRFGTQVDEDTVMDTADLRPGQRIRFGMYMLLELQEVDPFGASDDSDATADVPDFFEPPVLSGSKNDANEDSFDSFLLRNDDLLSMGLPVAAPSVNSTLEKSATAPSATKTPAPRETPARTSPPPSAPLSAPASFTLDSDLQSSIDPLASRPGGHAFISVERSPKSAGDDPVISGSALEIKRDDHFEEESGLFSIAGDELPLLNKAPFDAALESPADDENHTRGLSPEAVAFMRGQWQRKARMRRLLMGAVVLVCLLVLGLVVWVFR